MSQEKPYSPNISIDPLISIDPRTVNPFKLPDDLGWVEELGKSREVVQEISHDDKKSQAVLTRLSDITSRAVSWLWHERIALGKLTIISGDPGLGKSLLTATMAAIVSKGGSWPLEETPCPIGSVVLLSAEDDPADTIKPRLEAVSADCERIHILQAIKDIDSAGNPTERMFSLKRDIALLEDLLLSLPDCRLIVIDPISAYLEGADSHKNSDVRGLLAPLAKFASNHNVAVVLVQHLNKNSGGSAMYRSMGSVAFVAAVRAAYVVIKDQNDPERRLVMPVKNNLATDNTGLAYSVHNADNGAPVIAWENEAITITADEALTPLDSNVEKTDTDWAIDFLEGELSDGPVPVAEINKSAKQVGVSPKCLRRAAEKLGIKRKKDGFNKGWVWSLPRHEDAQEYEDAHLQNEGILGAEGHLRKEIGDLIVKEGLV